MTFSDTVPANVWPIVRVGAVSGELPSIAANCLVRVEVDSHLLLPAMFTLTFEDLTGAAVTSAGLEIGARVQVLAHADEGGQLIVGEVTAIEGQYQGGVGQTVIRGYDLCHRLQRARRTRSFHEVTDSDIARRIAMDAGLPSPRITATQTVHKHMLQCNQTDWEFLTQRAREIGFEFGMFDGSFQFRNASSALEPDGTSPELAMPGSLLRFEPRVTAGNVTPDVEVRVWDPLQARLSTAAPSTSTTSASGPPDLAGVATKFRTVAAAPPPTAASPGSEPGAQLGPAPSPTAHVVTTLPVTNSEEAAKALAISLGGSFAEAEGHAVGNPAIKAGTTVHVRGIPKFFPSMWLVSRARHVFDLTENGYHTQFTAGGPHDRSLLNLSSAGGADPVRIPGLACAVVDAIGGEYARVRLTLPWLSTDVRTDWAPVVQFGAGQRSGAMFLPEVGDHVLVGFEFGDPRRPYVLGGLVTAASKYSLGDNAVSKGAGGADSSVTRRGFVSVSGNRLVFHDESGEGEGQSRILLGTGDGTVGLGIDATNGQLTIQCGQAGTVNIQAGPDGQVNIDGGNELTLKSATTLNIKSQGTVSISGASIALGG